MHNFASSHKFILYSTSDVSSILEFAEVTVIEQVLGFCSTVHIQDDIVPTVTHFG